MRAIQYFITISILVSLSACKKSSPDNSNNGTGPDNGQTKITLAITDFSPKSAKPGSTITITGTGFGSDSSAVTVMVGNTQYDKIVSVSPTTITIQTNLATPSGKIAVLINGSNTVTSTDDFTALPPDLAVSGYDPNGQLGHQMYIHGNGFGTDTSKINISFGGTNAVKANYIASDGLAIGAIVPRYAKEGTITVSVGTASVTNSQSFLLNMSIRDYSPKSFHVGDTVKITGVKFTTTTDMSVQFNDSKVTRPISVTPTQMVVIVPYTTKSGYLTVSAAFGTISDFTSDKFTVLP